MQAAGRVTTLQCIRRQSPSDVMFFVGRTYPPASFPLLAHRASSHIATIAACASSSVRQSLSALEAVISVRTIPEPSQVVSFRLLLKTLTSSYPDPHPDFCVAELFFTVFLASGLSLLPSLRWLGVLRMFVSWSPVPPLSGGGRSLLHQGVPGQQQLLAANMFTT